MHHVVYWLSAIALFLGALLADYATYPVRIGLAIYGIVWLLVFTPGHFKMYHEEMSNDREEKDGSTDANP